MVLIRLRLDGDHDNQRDGQCDDGAAEQYRHEGARQFTALLHRGLNPAPALNRQYRQNAARRGQHHPQAVADSGDGQGGHELNDRDATGDECERRADRGEECPLVGEREAIVQILVIAVSAHDQSA